MNFFRQSGANHSLELLNGLNGKVGPQPYEDQENSGKQKVTRKYCFPIELKSSLRNKPLTSTDI